MCVGCVRTSDGVRRAAEDLAQELGGKEARWVESGGVSYERPCHPRTCLQTGRTLRGVEGYAKKEEGSLCIDFVCS